MVGTVALLGAGAVLTGAVLLGAPSGETEQAGAATGPSPTTGPDPGAGTVELTAPTGDASTAGSWSPGTEPGAAAVVPAGSSFPPSAPSCDTEGCALWRSTVLDQRPLLVNDRVAIQLGLELLIAVDLDTGQWLWSRGHNDPRGVSPAAAMTASYLDDRTLVIAYGHRLRLHAADTGSVLGEVDLAPTQVTDIRRHDGQLVVSGGTRDRERPGTRLVGLDDTGQVRFEVEVARPIRQAAPARSSTAPLLAVADGDLVGFDATDGSERWRRPVGRRQVDGTTLLDPTTGEVTVVSTRDGLDLLSVERPGAVAAGVRGGVLVVTHPDRVEVHDRDGVAMGEVAVAAPERTVVDTTGRFVTVATLPAPGATAPEPTIRIGRRASGSVALPTLTRSTSVPLPPGVEPAPVLAMRRPDGLLLAGPEAGWAWVMDRVGGTVTDLDLRLLPTTEVEHGAGLTLLRDGRQVTVLGAGGSFRARGVPQIASLDPLLLHGGTGTLRLDRTLVDRLDEDRG
ncbi:MAG: PQQ-binding-like beta-propeller repeat protein [Nitriliruptoraceae bacterium]